MIELDMSRYENGLRLRGKLQHDLAVAALTQFEECQTTSHPSKILACLTEYAIYKGAQAQQSFNLLMPADYRPELHQALEVAHQAAIEHQDVLAAAGYDELRAIVSSGS